MIDPSHQRRFGGLARIYGQQALERLNASHVMIIGVGGVGSWAVEALARSGIGTLTLIDMDHVSESNINRQLPALENTLGRAKVQVLAERIAQINPHCRVIEIEEMVAEDNLPRLIQGDMRFVVDCIDGYRTKAAVIAHCRRAKIPIISAGGAGGRRDPSRIRQSDLSRSVHDPLLAKTRKLLRRDYGFSSNPKRRFEVAAVWSEEQPSAPPAEPGEMPSQRPLQGLNCAGFGSSMAVTATFGLHLAAYVLGKIAAQSSAAVVAEAASPSLPRR